MNRKPLFYALLLLICASIGLGALFALDPDPTVVVETGKVAGREDGGLFVFKGIPYAAPPERALRWRPPQPAAAWQGVRSAKEFGAVCPQASSPGMDEALLKKMSEDCLTLNIWTPTLDEAAGLPVMFWIHGGGHVAGASSLPLYDGRALAAQGVVLVSINYRLNIFGYFAHPAVSKAQADEVLGNYGLLDQVAALEWVQRNISGFGGDPGNVTIFGESAGAGAVNYLLAATNTQGLFHRAVSQSTAVGLRLDPMLKRRSGGALAAERQGEIFAALLGVDGQDDVMAAMRAASMDELVRALDPRLQHRPLVDGKMLTDRLGVLFMAGRHHRVPYMVGANSWEASLGVSIGGGFSPEALARSMTPELRRSYYGNLDETAAVHQWFGDSIILSPSRFLAGRMADAGAPTYLYHLSYVTESLRGEQPGAAHGDDIPYIFQTLDAAFDVVSERDRETSRLISAYWVQFAKTGSPNDEGLVSWPEYSSRFDTLLEIGDEIVERAAFLKDRLDFHESTGLKTLSAVQ